MAHLVGGGGQQAQKGATLSHGKGAGRGLSMRGLDQAFRTSRYKPGKGEGEGRTEVCGHFSGGLPRRKGAGNVVGKVQVAWN